MARSSLHDRLYRLLLRLFPSEFRADFGEGMRADFDEQRRELNGSRRGVRRLWLRTAVDLLQQAPREHLDVLSRDASYGIRMLRRHPASTATAVISLALGVGLNAAIFSIVSGVLWRELPFPESERLVLVDVVSPSEPFPVDVSPSAFVEISRRARTLDPLAAAAFNTFTIVEPGEPEQIACAAVTERFFEVLQASPVLGRRLTATDYAQAAADDRRTAVDGAFGIQEAPPRVAVISHQLWQQRFSGDPGVVGRWFRVTGNHRVEIVGVMGPQMESLSGAVPGRCWYPQHGSPNSWWGGSVAVIGRLAPDVTFEQTEAELKVIGENLTPDPLRRRPGTADQAAPVLRAEPVLERIVGRVRTQMVFLLGAVLCVLLATWANVVNLFLAHASGRRDELATRVALGATRARLVRQTLTETLLVSVSGGACGLVVALWAVPALVAIAPRNVPRLDQVTVDWSTLSFTAAVSLAIGIVCGVLAVFPGRFSSAGLGPARARATARTSRFRNGLTVCEVALALMLVVSATLMVRTVRALGNIELGFDPANVVAADLSSSRPTLVEEAQEDWSVVEQVKALPGVRAAGVGLGPLAGGMFVGGLVVPGNPRAFDLVRVDAVSPGYFEALGVGRVAGRFFEPHDVAANGPRVILVNEAAAEAFWNGADPMGKSVVLSKEEHHVIGVVANLRGQTLEAEPDPTIYQLSTQTRNFRAGTMLIRVDGEAEALVPAVRAIIRSHSPESPFRGITTLQSRIDRAMAPRVFFLRVTGIFSLLALIVAVVGVYGVLAELVVQRVPEIGIRMAMGATAGDVARLVAGQGSRLVITGVVVGLAGAMLLRNAMSTLVYGVETLDPATYATACLCLIAATALGCAAPARRATRVDPVVALRLD